jgi:tetratricopeptide (TPR) repeat protein
MKTHLTFLLPRLAAGIALVMLLGAGCKTGGLSEAERREVEQRQKLERENELQLQRLRQLQEKTARQFLEMELRGMQKKWSRQASLAFRGGEYDRCLEIIETIYNPPPKTEKIRVPVFEKDSSGNPTAVRKKDKDGRPVSTVEVRKTPYPVIDLGASMESSLRALAGNAKYRLSLEAEDPSVAAKLLAECVAAFRQAQKVDPGNRAARRNLGKILFKQAERDPEHADDWYRQALKEWQAELSAGYRDAELMVLVGQALYETDRKEAAARSLECAIPEMPDNFDLIRFLSSVYAEIGRYDEALRLFDRILEINPFHTGFLSQRAHVLMKMKRNGEAVRTLEILKAAGQMRKHHWTTLGDLYSLEGMPGPAADSLLKAYPRGWESIVESHPRDAVLVADLLVQANRPASRAAGRADADGDTAEKILTRIRKDTALPPGTPDPVFADAQFTLGRLYQGRALGGGLDRDEAPRWGRAAIEAYRKSLSEVETNGLAWIAVGEIAFSLGQRDFKIVDPAFLATAEDAFLRASGLPESTADGFFGLGDVWYCRGEMGKARDFYNKALEARPGDPAIQGALDAVTHEINMKKRKS